MCECCSEGLSNNLLPRADRSSWYSWTPRKAISPIFSKEYLAGEPVLKIKSSGKFEDFGKWMCEIPGIEGGETYRFSVEYLPESISHERVSLHAMLTWIMEDGKPITRDYVDRTECLGNGWKSLYRVIDAPGKACKLRVELVFKWSENGAVTWRNPLLVKTSPIEHRLVKIASAFTTMDGTAEGNLKAILAAIDKAGSTKPDVICLTETPYSAGTWGSCFEDRCVVIPGPVTDAIGEKARKYNSYVILSLFEKDGDFIYNTGLLFDRQGNIAGKYHKLQLPLCEAEDGVTPGREYPVFETDFGKIGIMICWDQGFPEVARILRLKGAEILFVPTLWHTDLAKARAMENGVFVVAACTRWTPSPCRIIAPDGEVISQINGGEYNQDGVCTATIDLDKRYYTFWLSVGAAYGEGPSVFLQERRADIFDLLSK